MLSFWCFSYNALPVTQQRKHLFISPRCNYYNQNITYFIEIATTEATSQETEDDSECKLPFHCPDHTTEHIALFLGFFFS